MISLSMFMGLFIFIVFISFEFSASCVLAQGPMAGQHHKFWKMVQDHAVIHNSACANILF